MAIGMMKVPVDFLNALSHVELYYSRLRNVFLKLRQDLPNATQTNLLQFYVSCMNNAMGTEWFHPSLCFSSDIINPIIAICSP